MMKATLSDLLYREEIKGMAHLSIPMELPLTEITVRQLWLMFPHVKLRTVINGRMPGGFISSLVLDELSSRSIDENIVIF